MRQFVAAPVQTPRPDVITGAFVAALRQAGVTQAWLFGSVARGEEGPESDIDLLVTFDREVFLFERLDIGSELSRIAGRRVDLLTDIHPVFEPYIRPTLISIPLGPRRAKAAALDIESPAGTTGKRPNLEEVS